MESFYEDHLCLQRRIELFRSNLHFLVLMNRGDFSDPATIKLSQDLDELLVIYTRIMDSIKETVDLEGKIDGGSSQFGSLRGQ